MNILDNTTITRFGQYNNNQDDNDTGSTYKKDSEVMSFKEAKSGTTVYSVNDP